MAINTTATNNTTSGLSSRHCNLTSSRRPVVGESSSMDLRTDLGGGGGGGGGCVIVSRG